MNKMSIQIDETKYSSEQIARLESAFVLAAKAHAGQLRKSGEPYITHPQAVAETLADWGMDLDTIIAGLLHDTVEDTPVTLSDIRRQFGDKVAELVDGVTKLGQVDFTPYAEGTGERAAISSENIRKLLLAMSRDLRVIIIKLADRRHNLMTLKFLSAEKQQRIAKESIEIYAPLADRLGMGRLKCEIEDISFQYVDPKAYKRVESLMSRYVRRSERYIEQLQSFVSEELGAAGVAYIAVEGRRKHLYSVHKKLQKTEGDITKIYDLIALRIIVPEVKDCYEAMGVLHQHFKPLIYRIKDYIAVPKPNGYRSLHTTVFALEGRITEFQIRTAEMHEEAEHGLAAHFYYDTLKGSRDYLEGRVSALPAKLSWVSQLADLNQTTRDSEEFVSDLKLDLFQDRIFVFSPRGDLYDLPEGSTPVDFAFAIHSDVGLRTQGALVNGRMVGLDTPLSNRDVVRILTRKQPSPSLDWLNFVRTPHARSRIKAWFRTIGRDNNVKTGRELLENELKPLGVASLSEVSAKLEEAASQLNIKDLDSLLASIGEGSLTALTVVRKLFPVPRKVKPSQAQTAGGGSRVLVGATGGVQYSLARCCKPVFPETIIGYITRGKGVTVHAAGCGNLPDDAERLIACRWSDRPDGAFQYRLRITAQDRLGLLSDLTGLIARLKINISGVKTETVDGITSAEVGIELPDGYSLNRLLRQLEQLPGIIQISPQA